jgi:hypothetical protein
MRILGCHGWLAQPCFSLYSILEAVDLEDV